MTSTIPDISSVAGLAYSNGLGDDKALLVYEDGTARFRHRCDRGQRGVIICAPLLMLGQGHVLTRDDQERLTVQPSILCHDCNTHGFVTDGVWRDC